MIRRRIWKPKGPCQACRYLIPSEVTPEQFPEAGTCTVMPVWQPVTGDHHCGQFLELPEERFT